MLAKRKLATDDDITVDDETMEKAMTFLKSRLEPNDLSSLMQMLKGEQADDEEEKKEDVQPKHGGKLVAADALGQSFNDRWPNVARIRLGY